MSKPDKAVEDARAMADNGYNAREIAVALSTEYGPVSKFTVYAWLKRKRRQLVQMYKTPNETSCANERK